MARHRKIHHIRLKCENSIFTNWRYNVIKYIKKIGNKGFTLVEMVVAFAILAIVMLTVTLVISTSSNTYGKIATDINLQYESQMAMSQLQEYVIDCNAYMAAGSDGNTLYIFNKTDAHYDAYKFVKKAGADELYFYKKTIESSTFNTADPGSFAFVEETGELMSSYVSAFSAAVSASSVTVTIKYGAGGKTYNGQQTIALRNQIQVISVPL